MHRGRGRRGRGRDGGPPRGRGRGWDSGPPRGRGRGRDSGPSRGGGRGRGGQQSQQIGAFSLSLGEVIQTAAVQDGQHWKRQKRSRLDSSRTVAFLRRL